MQQEMMDMVMVQSRTLKIRKAHHHTNINTRILQAGCPSCGPNNSVKAQKAIMHTQKGTKKLR